MSTHRQFFFLLLPAEVQAHIANMAPMECMMESNVLSRLVLRLWKRALYKRRCNALTRYIRAADALHVQLLMKISYLEQSCVHEDLVETTKCEWGTRIVHRKCRDCGLDESRYFDRGM